MSHLAHYHHDHDDAAAVDSSSSMSHDDNASAPAAAVVTPSTHLSDDRAEEPVLLRGAQVEHHHHHLDDQHDAPDFTLAHMHAKYNIGTSTIASSSNSTTTATTAPLCPDAMFEPSTSFLTLLTPPQLFDALEDVFRRSPLFTRSNARFQRNNTAFTLHLAAFPSTGCVSIVVSVFSTERDDAAHVVEVQRRQGDALSFRQFYAALVESVAPHILAMLDGRPVGAHYQPMRSMDPPPIGELVVDDDALDQHVAGLMMQRAERSCLSEARHSMNWMASRGRDMHAVVADAAVAHGGGVSPSSSLPSSSSSSSSSSPSSSSPSTELAASSLLSLVLQKFANTDDLEQRRAALALLLQSPSLANTASFAGSVDTLVRALFQFLQQGATEVVVGAARSAATSSAAAAAAAAATPSVALTASLVRQEVRQRAIEVLRWLAAQARFSHALRHDSYLSFLRSPGAHLPSIDEHEVRDLHAVLAALQ